MNKAFSFVLILLTISASIQSQDLYFKFLAGTANYQGDLKDSRYSLSRGGPAFSAGVHKFFNPHFSVRSDLSYAQIKANDGFNKPELHFRNLDFNTNIYEFNLALEYTFFDMDVKRLSPYLFGGVGVFRFNPYTLDASGSKVFLQPLTTEGQGLPSNPGTSPYSLTAFSAPFGGGFRYAISDNYRIGFELGLRPTSTDYLDDVSTNYADFNELLNAKGQIAVDLAYRADEIPGGNPVYPQGGAQRGSPLYKDWYYFTGFHFLYKINGGRDSEWGSKKRKTACPKW